MKLRLAALMFVFVAACSSEPPPPDMKNPVSVASAFVAAYNTKDLARMLPLVDQVNLDAIKDAISGGPDSEAWQGIFAPEIVAILAREGGRVEGPRYEGRDAVVKVGASDTGDVFTVELAQGKDDRWLIVENAILSAEEFAKLPAEPKKSR
jgi:hypothetical protein